MSSMSGSLPVSVYALRIPPGEVLIPAVPEFAAMFRVTMAAIDPSEEPEADDAGDQRPPRATLKMVRFEDDQLLDDESDEDSDEDEDELNGGPSNKMSHKRTLLEALAAHLDGADSDEDMDEDEDEDEDEDDQVGAAKLIKELLKKDKGKGKAVDGLEKVADGDEEEEEDEDDESDEALEMDEVVLCTLDPEKHWQQSLDFVVGEGEKVFFKVSGTHTIHLTGNYLMPLNDLDEDDEEDEYDLSPDEDELDALEDEEEESDELDDLADPRVTELGSDNEEMAKLTAASKGKNKRPVDDSDAEEDLDTLVAKSMKVAMDTANGEPQKLSKAEKKAAKKLKKNNGEPAATTSITPDKKADAVVNGSEKKTVQFAKNLEQGPTPSTTPPAKKEEVKKDDSKKAGSNSTTVGVRNVNGVTVDDRKIGSGPGARKGSKVDMRYIGKLEDGKVFDSNKGGKPFSFKLGLGEVIKGWDIGLEGISAGGERRITIPANLAYGNKALPGIPKNSKLTFDVRCLSVK